MSKLPVNLRQKIAQSEVVKFINSPKSNPKKKKVKNLNGYKTTRIMLMRPAGG